MIGAILVGVLAGVVAGITGTGGGTLFVPALVLFLGLSHLDAEATSLLAIIPVALVGAWRQRSYGNLRIGDAAALGGLASGGALLGVVVANSVPERALEIGFACLLLFAAAQLARDALRTPADVP